MTLRELSQISGFSIKTISRVVNGSSEVNSKTRTAITRVLKKYDYHPDLNARGLRTRRTNRIGFVLPDIANNYFAEIAHHLERVCERNNYNLIISFTKESRSSEKKILRLLASNMVDGIVLATSGIERSFIEEILERYETPIVVIDNRIDSEKVDLVLQDNIDGSRKLTEHLIDMGYRNIGIITGLLRESSGLERLEGYQKALRSRGFTLKKGLVVEANWTAAGGYKAAVKLFDKGIPVDSLLVCNALMGVGAYRRARELGLKIPEDLGMVVFEPLDLMDYFGINLTCLESITGEMAEKAMEVLLERLSMNHSKPKEALIRPGIREGKSSISESSEKEQV